MSRHSFLRLFAYNLFLLISTLVIVLLLNELFPSLSFLTLGVIVAISSSLFFSYYFSRFYTRRLSKITSFVESVGKGQFNRSLIPSNADEIGRLESHLNRMAADLKNYVDALSEEEGKKGAVVSSMGDGVVVIDNSGMVTLANKRATKLFGPSLTGKKMIDISRDPRLLELIEEGQSRLGAVNGEISINEASPIILHVTLSPFIRNMKNLGGVIVFHDITDLKKLENMRKDFVANVSHELKTPLTSIKGYAETLIEGGIDDRENALKFTGVIKKNADRLSRLVNDLLTLSNIELGKVEFHIRSVNVADAVHSVFSTLEQKGIEKGLKLDSEIDVSLSLLADRDRLEQILLNLVDNGIKYTEKGSVAVSARKEGGEVVVSVSDTGAGIPKRDLSRMGERFYRVDPARSRELGGTGLGLAIVKHLVASMGGTFFVGSEEGRGTTVRFRLPAG